MIVKIRSSGPAYNPSFPPKNQNQQRRAACLQNFLILMDSVVFNPCALAFFTFLFSNLTIKAQRHE